MYRFIVFINKSLYFSHTFIYQGSHDKTIKGKKPRQSDLSTFIETEAYCTLIYILISYLPLYSLEYKN